MIVTGDHSHTLTIAGYAKRGNPILGISVGVDGKPRLGSDGKPYTTVGFANGPGGTIPLTERPTLTMEQATAPDFIQPALVPLKSETHGGEDLGIYAIGPGPICSRYGGRELHLPRDELRQPHRRTPVRTIATKSRVTRLFIVESDRLSAGLFSCAWR